MKNQVKKIITTVLMVSMGTIFSSQASEKSLECVLEGMEDFIRSNSENSPLPGSAFKLEGERIIYASGIDYAPLNGVFEISDSIPPEIIDETIEFFSSRNLPFVWWSSCKELEKKGFHFGGEMRGISLDISWDLPKAPKVSDFSVRLLTTQKEIENLMDLVSQVFGLTPTVNKQYKIAGYTGFQKKEQMHFIGYYKGIPVASLTMVMGESYAGIWHLSTLQEYRKKGIASALVHASLKYAKEQGYENVMALLMPKGLAWGLFQKMGFKEVCAFPFYLYGFDADKLEK